MDAASCYILGNDFVPIEVTIVLKDATERLIET